MVRRELALTAGQDWCVQISYLPVTLDRDRSFINQYCPIKLLNLGAPIGDVMAIIPRGANTYLIRVYLGRDVLTKRRIEINTTVHGSLASAKKVEAKLRGQKELGSLIKTSQMTVNKLLDDYLDSVRHLQSKSTQYKYRTFLTYYVRPYIGHISLKKVNSGIIQELFNFLLDQKNGENKGNDV